MKTANELDELVAKNIMGWTDSEKDKAIKILIKGYPRYSTDIAAAWEVVNKISKDDFHLTQMIDGGVIVTFTNIKDGRDVTAAGSTPAHAICLAALKALGVEV